MSGTSFRGTNAWRWSTQGPFGTNVPHYRSATTTPTAPQFLRPRATYFPGAPGRRQRLEGLPFFSAIRIGLFSITFITSLRPLLRPLLQPGDRQRRGAFRVGGTKLFFRESLSAFLCEGIRKSEFTSSNLRPQPHLHRRTFSVIFIPPTPPTPPPSP
jgi:hypothetical protein